jgi:hypothetical protein
VFDIQRQELDAGLRLDDALAEIDALHGTSGLYGIYRSSDFIMRQEGASDWQRQQYSAGFALMVYGVRMGLAARGRSLPTVADEVETVSQYEQMSRIRLSAFESAHLKAALCACECDLVIALDNVARETMNRANGVPVDLFMFWHGATSAYLALSHAAADNTESA